MPDALFRGITLTFLGLVCSPLGLALSILGLVLGHMTVQLDLHVRWLACHLQLHSKRQSASSKRVPGFAK